MFRQISSRIRLPRNSRDLLHAANLRHGTGGFTSPPKEGVMRIFSPLKIQRLRPGLNPRTWVPKPSTLPLDHRSRSCECTLRKTAVGANSTRPLCAHPRTQNVPSYRTLLLPSRSQPRGQADDFFCKFLSGVVNGTEGLVYNKGIIGWTGAASTVRH